MTIKNIIHMKRLIYFVSLIVVCTSCDYWPSHNFYVQNSIPNSVVRLEFEAIGNSGDTEAVNHIKEFVFTEGQNKLVRVVLSANTGTKKAVINVFDEFGDVPTLLPFTLYVNDVPSEKALYTKEFWDFTSHDGYGDYVLVLTEDMLDD